MRKKLLFIAAVIATLFAQAQNNKIVLGTIDTLHSKILNEQRKIWVYVPNAGPQDIYAKAKYPVVYLLDGDAHFYSVVGMIQQLSSVNGNTVCPQMIVVGIPNTDRTRDLTPSHVDSDPMLGNTVAVKTSGGGEKFMSFIEKELIPYIDATYPTLPYRTLIGHSLGGLTVINTLINHKDLFNAYIAIDPSMWWDKRSLLTKANTVLSSENYKGKTLFLGIANTMSEGMDTTGVKKDTSLATDHIRSILTLNAMLEHYKNNGLSYNYKYYANDTHGSVPLITTYDALRFIFSFYNFQMQPQDFMNFTLNTVKKLESHYNDVSEHFGFAYPIPETIANQLGYMAMQQKKMDEAEYLFKINIANYPTSLNVYDSMGDFYAAKGDKEKAVEYYKKALAVKEWPDTRSKLNALVK